MTGFWRIPAELQTLDRWCVWRWEPDPEHPKKPRKPPYQSADPDRHASSIDPRTWSTFEDGVACVRACRADGIGFALMPPFVGIDLDEELSLNEQWQIMLCLYSYAEVSPSGKGHHVIVKASLNGEGRHRQGIGVFTDARFWYCTGEHVPELPTTIEERQAELEAVIEEYLPKPAATDPDGDDVTISQPRQPVDLDDRELLERMFASKSGPAIRRLWEGDCSQYPSQSEADLALACHLVWWTDRDPDRIDSLFRPSGLMRPKWDRPDYRAADDRGRDRGDDRRLPAAYPQRVPTPNRLQPLY